MKMRHDEVAWVLKRWMKQNPPHTWDASIDWTDLVSGVDREQYGESQEYADSVSEFAVAHLNEI